MQTVLLSLFVIMKLDKEKIAAIRLQELGLQLDGIIRELDTIINAPAKTIKVSNKDRLNALAAASIEKSLNKRRNKINQ